MNLGTKGYGEVMHTFQARALWCLSALTLCQLKMACSAPRTIVIIPKRMVRAVSTFVAPAMPAASRMVALRLLVSIVMGRIRTQMGNWKGDEQLYVSVTKIVRERSIVKGR